MISVRIRATDGRYVPYLEGIAVPIEAAQLICLQAHYVVSPIHESIDGPWFEVTGDFPEFQALHHVYAWSLN
jgi:hypothetical protein